MRQFSEIPVNSCYEIHKHSIQHAKCDFDSNNNNKQLNIKEYSF